MSAKSMSVKVVIVGAGLSGLVTAYNLAKLGVEFQLLEARERFGGWILTLDSIRSSARFDLGPSWLWANQRHIEQLINELGVDDRIYQQYAKGDSIFEPQGGSLQRGVAGISMAGAYRLEVV
ncbi:MAG: monoamine oxidase [Arenicella sp.]|jgi:monoamine oxidase